MTSVIKNTLFILFFCAVASQVYSQNNFNITYNFGFLTSSDLKDYIGEDSWRGWQFEYEYSFNGGLSLGLLSGYQGFYEKRDRETYEIGNITANAVTWRYYRTIPVLMTGKYYFKTSGFQPYLGFGMGAYFISQELQITDRLVSDNNAAFGLLGELGFLIPAGKYWSIILDGKFNQGFYDNADFNVSDMSYFTIGTGIRFRL